MPTDIEKLVVQLDADIRSYQRNLLKSQGLTRGWQRQIDTSTKAAEKRFQQMQQTASRSVTSVESVFSGLGKGLAIGIGTAASLKGFQDLADAATRVQNALKVAGLSGTDLTDVYTKLFASAQKNAVPIEAMVTLFSRASTIQKELGVSTQDLVSFTDNVGKALRVAGTDAETASGSLLQLSQALGSGTVHAEEFNSILEGALPIAQAAAAGITAAGGSVAKLKQLVIDGKLSSQEFFRGIQNGAKILNERLQGSVLTVDQALTRLRNTLVDAAGKINDVSGATQTAVVYISKLGDYIEALSRVFTAAAGSSIGNYINKLNELAKIAKNIPAFNPFAGLPSVEELNQIADKLTTGPVQKLKDARDQLAETFSESVPRGKRSPATEDQIQQVDKLVAGLRDGSVTADQMTIALAHLGPKFATLAAQLKPFIDALKEAETSAQAMNAQVAKAALTNSLTHPSGDTILSDQKKQQDIVDKRLLEASRSDAEKDIDTRAKQISKALADAGQTITDAAAKILAKAEIANERVAKATDDAVSGFADRVVTAESGGVNTAKNPLSTATGPGQFIEKTWLNLFQKYFPERADGMTRDAILALRTDQATSKQLIEAYARENAAILQKAGVSVDEAALHLAHFLGPQGAIKVLSAAPGTPIAGLLSQQQINANKSILGNGATVDTVRAYAEQRAGMKTAGALAVDAKLDFETQLNEQKQQIVALKEESGIRASLNPLVEDYGRKLSETEKAQELFKIAQQEGTAAGKELSSAQQLLNGDISKLSPEAQKQALAMRGLALEYGSVTASSNALEKSQEKLKEQATAFADATKDVVGGALTDIRSAMEDGKITAKEWGDVLVGVLNKIADKLQDLLLDQLFKPSTFSGLFGILGGAVNVGGSVGGGVASAPVKAPTALLANQLKAPDALNRAVNSKIGSLPTANNAPSHVVVSVDDDGAIQAYVERQGQKTEVSVLAKSKASLDQYRRGQQHQDIETHLKNRRVRGTI